MIYQKIFFFGNRIIFKQSFFSFWSNLDLINIILTEKLKNLLKDRDLSLEPSLIPVFHKIWYYAIIRSKSKLDA